MCIVATYLIYFPKTKLFLHLPEDRVKILWQLLRLKSVLNVSSQREKSWTDINENFIDQRVVGALIDPVIAQKRLLLDGAVTVALALGD